MKKYSFSDLDWKQKNKLLLLGIALMLWLVYAFAISRTLETRSTCILQQSRLDSALGAPERLLQIETELAKFTLVTGEQNDSVRDMHEHLLNFITVYSNEHALQLREFNQPIRYRQLEWMVETHPFTVEGTYLEIVQLLLALERSGNGRVVSVDLHTRTDNKTKVKSLLATIYIQNITTEAS